MEYVFFYSVALCNSKAGEIAGAICHLYRFTAVDWPIDRYFLIGFLILIRWPLL